ncbi:fibronectin type III domain-containing protein [Micromonospora echinofusca]|uniref:fibronectin type III domain-containing protein n=1 Tax=Micromonospora echinofusca TaxID=47858 RepID=UPI003433686A
MSATAVNDMFNSYGNAGGHWTGGDGTASVALPDGRVAWLFADSFLGTVNADGSRPANSPMVNNLIVVQEGDQLTRTLHGGTVEGPSALVKPAQSGEHYWITDGVVEGDTLKVIYNRIRTTGSGALDFEQTGVALATFALPALTLTSVVDLPLGPKISWGAGIFPDGAYTYIYGLSSAPGRMKFAHLARVPAGGLSGAWEFWTGSAWSPDLSAVGRLISGVDGGGVQKVGNQYVWVTHESNLLFDPQFVAYTSPSPTGPFTGPIQLFSAPETQTQGLFVYNARVHPDLARSGKLLVSYDVNDFTPGGTTANVMHGRPRFVEVDWPRPAPGTGLPPAPAAPALTGQNDTVQVSWPAVTGASSYRVYQRDVTGGQTHFARLPQPTTQLTKEAGFLVAGHTYEYKVTAVNNNGEGPPSPVGTVTPHSTKPVTEAIVNANVSGSVAGSYIVGLKETTPKDSIADYAQELVAQAGGTLDSVLVEAIGGFGATMSQTEAIDLAAHPDVAFVEHNATLTMAGEQIDPPWHLDRIDQRPRPFDDKYVYPNEGGGVRAYVLDTGVNGTHTDFGDRVAEGYNAFDKSDQTSDCGRGHGTHVAGILGGQKFGVAKQVEIVPVKVLECDANGVGQGTHLSVLGGVSWLLRDAANGGPAVVNMSLSAPRGSTALDLAARKVVAGGLPVFVAAGNRRANACLDSPSRAAKNSAIVSVGATSSADARWLDPDDPQVGSNWGECVDIFAPGMNVLSLGISSDTSLSTQSGTSMATPAAAGVAAMMLADQPGYTPEQIKRLMLGAATTDALTDLGTGSPNRLLFVERRPTTAPPGLTAASRPDGTIRLDWDPVPDAGVHYRIEYRDLTAGEPEFNLWDQSIFNATDATFGIGIEGHNYEFKVAAANSAGIGPFSAPAQAAVDKLPPAAPTALTATSQADGSIKLAWNSTPGLWHYVYLRDLDADGGPEEFRRLDWPVTEGNSMTLGSLKHNHEYEAYVTAIDDAGESQPSNLARATSNHPLPAGPTNLVGTAGDRRVTLTWQSAGDGVWYRIHMRNVTAGETSFTTLGLPVTTCCTFVSDQLTNGSAYEFKVTAMGADGAPDSAPSNVVRVTPVGLPADPPSNLVATPGNARVDLTWVESTQPDAWYWIEMRPAGGTWQRLDLPITTCCEFASTGLTNGTTYEYRVRTIGANGGPDSAPSNVASAKPLAPPAGAPSNLRARAGNGRVDLTWTASSTPGAWYWIEMRNVSAGQSWQRLSLPVTSCCSFPSTSLTNGDTYEYRVVTVGANGGPDSPPSNVASARPVAPTPAPPSNLRATAGNARVDLTWTASSTPGAWYWIEMRNVSAGQSWQRLSLPVTSCCSFASTSLTNGDTYEYRIRTVGGGGAPDSAASNTVSARPVAPQPSPPSNLTATAGDGRVTLKWTASPTSGVWYWVYQRDVTAGQSWRKIATPVSTCCTYLSLYLTNGHTYEYRVAAIGSGGAPDSSMSNIASARPMPPFPTAPTNLSATGGDNEAWLKWSASSPAGVAYNVYQRTRYASGYGAWIKLPLPALKTSMTAGYLTYGYTYEFKVTATNLAGESAASNTVSVLIVPASANSACVSANSSYRYVYQVGYEQRWDDVFGRLCMTRSNFSVVFDKSWSIGGSRRLETSSFWYQLLDCDTGAEVSRQIQNYQTDTDLIAWADRTYISINPARRYRIVLSGYGTVRLPTHFRATFSRHAQFAVPFEASSRCF